MILGFPGQEALRRTVDAACRAGPIAVEILSRRNRRCREPDEITKVVKNRFPTVV